MILSLPLSVTIPRKKGDRVWILNLNSYRNTHFHVLNQVKELYSKLVYDAIPHDGDFWETSTGPFMFTYMIYPGNNRAFDLSNVCSVIDKFTCDALVDMGIIKDDNHKVIRKIAYEIGTVDKEHPRCTLKIETFKEEK